MNCLKCHSKILRNFKTGFVGSQTFNACFTKMTVSFFESFYDTVKHRPNFQLRVVKLKPWKWERNSFHEHLLTYTLHPTSSKLMRVNESG